VGAPRLLVMASVGWRDRIFLTPWRHQKDASGLILDVGVHYGDMMEFFLASGLRLRADAALRACRYRPSPTRRVRLLRTVAAPRAHRVHREDAAYAVLTFASGVVAPRAGQRQVRAVVTTSSRRELGNQSGMRRLLSRPAGRRQWIGRP